MLTRTLIAIAVVVGALSGAVGAQAATVSGSYVVVLKDDTNAPAAEKAAEANGARISQHYRHALKGYAAQLSSSALTKVKADPAVAFVSPDYELHADEQAISRPVDRIDGELSSTGSGDGFGSVNVNVAVIDSGIDRQPELNVAGGTSCVNGNSGDAFNDQDRHGTMVSGLLAERDNTIGLAGVAPGARLWAIKVLKGNGTGTVSQIVCGIDAVTASRTDSDPTNDIAVANMSVGGGAPSRPGTGCADTGTDAIYKAICTSIAAGVIYVVSAGNESDDLAAHVPASYDEVLTAAAMTDIEGAPGGVGVAPNDGVAGCLSSFTGPAKKDSVSDDTAAFLSNYATSPADAAHTLAAPGVCSVSLWPLAACATKQTPNPTECYSFATGTSFASPLIAGTVALCIASGPCNGLTPAQIKTKIVADAAAYNQANPGYGFQGDPLRPITGKYYGYLIRAGIY